MNQGTIFISHRAEYSDVVRKLKKTIQDTSNGRVQVFISEDIPRGEKWRHAIEDQLQQSESLLLVYGAPHEDWSWCFYEAGYFAALQSRQGAARQIYCLVRPNVPPPGPLNHLQIVNDKEALIGVLLSIYSKNNANHNAVDVRARIDDIEKNLFGTLSNFENYPRVYFSVNDADFVAEKTIPAHALLTSDESVLRLLFGVGKTSIAWGDVAAAVAHSLPPNQTAFVSKWVEETSRIILAGRDSKYIPPQTVLMGTGGTRFRFLLYAARKEGDGRYCCEFLVIDEVGGPPIGLPGQLLSLLTGIRMGFRLRYELIRRFPNDFVVLSEKARKDRIEEFPRVIDNLLSESDARGNFNLEDLVSAFDEVEGERLRKLVGYWPDVKEKLYKSLGLSSEGKVVSDDGLRGANVELFRNAFDALNLINGEFMSRCCARVSRMMAKSEDQLKEYAIELDAKLRDLTGPTLQDAA